MAKNSAGRQRVRWRVSADQVRLSCSNGRHYISSRTGFDGRSLGGYTVFILLSYRPTTSPSGFDNVQTDANERADEVINHSTEVNKIITVKMLTLASGLYKYIGIIYVQLPLIR